MTLDEYHGLRNRIDAGEQLTHELRNLRSLVLRSGGDEEELWPLADLFALALEKEWLLPRVEAAKALVDIAIAGDFTYPVVCPFDSAMKRALSSDEKAEVFDYIALRIGHNRSPQSYSASADLADYLMDIEPS